MLLAALRAGMDVSLAHLRGFDLDAAVLEEARGEAARSDAAFEQVDSMESAAEGSHVIYARPRPLSSHGNPTLTATAGA